MSELNVTKQDIKVKIYFNINFFYQASKINVTIKELKKSKNQALLKELKNIISKWKKVVNQDEPEKNTNTNPKPKPNPNPNPKVKSPIKEEKDEFPEKYLLDGVSHRNNTRKKLYLNLKTCLENEEDKETKKKELIEKVVKIEEIIYSKLKGDSPYTNRVLEILHNIKTNEEFKKQIVKGIITPEKLATMDVIDMVDKNKKEEIEEAIKNKVNSVRSDWDQKHAKVTSGVYKCRKCGCDKTTQHEMQTRSADEPMTLFIHCVECGNSWKIQISIIYLCFYCI